MTSLDVESVCPLSFTLSTGRAVPLLFFRSCVSVCAGVYSVGAFLPAIATIPALLNAY